MSRFIDKLNQVSQAAPRPMGFKAAQSALEKPRIQIIASLAQADTSRLADSLAGADAGLLRISRLDSGLKALKEMCQIVPDIPCGVWLSGDGSKGIKLIAKAGCDFIVFSAASTSLSILQDNKIGKILEVEGTLDEGLLRAVNELSIDAVLIGGEQGKGQSLACVHLIIFQYFASLLDKPLLVSVPSSTTASELQVLWDAGVSGVVIEVGAEEPIKGLAALRQEIDKVTFSPRHKRKKTEVALPYISRETDITAEEEEE